jgi:hypothetical protein
MSKIDEFVASYRQYITREGADKLLEYLQTSDFFTAPASTKYHGSYESGLVEHSVNVYHCLKDYLARDSVKYQYNLDFSDETIAVVSLLHDLCKINCYELSFRNVKNEETEKWEKAAFYIFNEKIHYGHGEKSVYIVSQFLKLTHTEATAIRFHMGFSRKEDNPSDVGAAFGKHPLSFALSTADMEATYFLDGKQVTNNNADQEQEGSQ